MLPLLQQAGELPGRTGEDRRVAGVLLPRELVEAVLAGGGGGPVPRVQEHRQVAEDVRRLRGPVGGLLRGLDSGHDVARLPGVARGHEADVRGLRDQPVGRGPVPQGRDDRLALRWPGGDGRALDAEVLTSEIDVMQFVPVDEPPGRDVTDLGVVLPAVPQPPDHLDVVGGLAEQPGDELAHRGIGVVTGAGHLAPAKCAASCGLAETRTWTPARPVLT